MTRLQTFYQQSVVPQLIEQFNYNNIMQVPKLTQITINMGVGEAVGDRKMIERAAADIRAIAGQEPVVTRARKSVSNFKVREGWPIGCKVNLRRERMYEFLDRLISIAIPRIRDFQIGRAHV